jgi:formamidopyrimidine-DNA glycosylase
MPELPEVETVRRRLLTCLPGLLLREVVINDSSVSEQSAEELTALVAGRRVTGLRRRGKYLLVDLGPTEGAEEAPARELPAPAAGRYAGPAVAVIHLRMTGQLVFRPAPGERPARFVWRLDPGTELHFQDVRRFGRLWAVEPAAEDDFFASRGPTLPAARSGCRRARNSASSA